MRTELFLAHKYGRGHKKQCVGIVLCVSLCIAAFMTSFLYRDCSFASFDQQNYENYGSYSAILYNVDPQQEQKESEVVASSKSGIVCVTDQISTDQNDISVYMGYMDSNALDLKAIHLKEGRLPKTKDEVSIEQATYTALGLTAVVGNEILLPIVQNGNERTEKFRLVGILQDYVSKWKRLDVSKVSVKSPPPGILMVPGYTSVRYMHILCNQRHFENDLGGQYVQNSYSLSNNKADLPAKKTYTDVFLFPLIAIFILVTVFSIYSIVLSTLSERQRFFVILRCIGLKKSRGKLLLLLQAAEFLSHLLWWAQY